MSVVMNKSVAGVIPVETNPAENVTNDDVRAITDSMCGVGDNYPQGDVYFVRIAGLPKSAKPRKDRQLADGDTQGSRHVCTVGNVFACEASEVSAMIADAFQSKMDPVTGATFAATRDSISPSTPKIGDQYIGPVVQTVDGRAVIEHPEHGDHQYEGEMVMACVFQRAMDAEEREARVRD